MDDGYRTLTEDARDALGALLRASEPGTGLSLHKAYTTLKRALQDDDQERERRGRAAKTAETKAAQEQWRSERDEAEKTWRRMSKERRETLVFQVLGDHRLIIREMTERMNAELGYRESKDGPRVLYGNEVAALAKRLWREGQLQRELERFNVNHTRYRYSRTRGLDGPIAELEQAFQDDSTAEEA